MCCYEFCAVYIIINSESEICNALAYQMTPPIANKQVAHMREFLEKCLGKKVLDYSLQALTKPGDNYGSTIQALTVTVTHHDDDVREFINVVKLVEKTHD